MSFTVRVLARACLFTTIVTALAATASGQVPSTPVSQDLTKWTEQFPVPASQLQQIALARGFSANEEIRPFTGQSVVGLGINGRVQFMSQRGLVRIVVADDQSNEYLVFESYPLIAAASSFSIRNVCRETCLLPPTVLTVLKVQLVDASLELQTIVMNQMMTTEGSRARAEQTLQQMQVVKKAQDADIIAALNQRIQAKGLRWIAGETSISRLSYAARQALLACVAGHPNTPPNLQGAEFYKGGILEISPADPSPPSIVQSSALIDSFDWRARHGANRPGSPYYDGDATGGGWLTSIKYQRCADCWAHAALGTTESVANLYFNQHLDFDLSEQELVSCSGAGNCLTGGFTQDALKYVQRAGVVDEMCFPESGIDESCGNCCTNPQERVMISGVEPIFPVLGEDGIKRTMIASGPVSFGIMSWWHVMVLAGYTRETGTGDTLWILKNSWGADWGENGYGYLKVPLSDIYTTYVARTPVLSLIMPHTIACRDADGDGYFNWGLSREAPSACGSVPPTEDCDDSDPAVALMTEQGLCTAAPATDTTPPAITVIVDPAVMWPPNRQFISVVVSGTITDAESGVTANAASYTVADDYGRVELTGPVPLDADGHYTFTVSLEAARRGDDLGGRRYRISVSARDEVGNSGWVVGVALVPHDMSRSVQQGQP